MAGTTYVVSIDLQTKGDFGAPKLSNTVSRLGSAFERMKATGDSAVSRLVSGIEDAAGRAMGLATAFAGWGLAAGTAIVGVAGYTVHLNNELEKARISLGAMFSAQGLAPNLNVGLKVASDQIVKMRKDAAALPGEFSDLLGIFRNIAIPGGQAGLGVDQIRGLASKIMAAGAVTGLPMDQVAREAAMLMSGRSGAHNVFGMRLMGLSGDAAKSFNEMAPDKRVAKMSAELDKYAPAIDEFSKSFEGVSSTFRDNVKTFAMMAGSPLFDKLKTAFAGANDWFTENKALISTWGAAVGDKLGYAFDIGLAKIREWWPAIQRFAENAYSRLVQVWATVQPYVERFGSALQTALQDPGTIDKLILLAKVWGGLKIAGALAGGIGGAMQLGGAVAAKAGGIGAAASGIAGAVSGAASSAFLSLTSGATIAGTTFVGLAGAAVTVTTGLAALAGAGLAVYEGFLLVGDLTKKFNADDDARIAMATKLFNSSDSLAESFANTQTTLQEYVDANNEAAAAAINFASAANAAYGVISGYEIASKARATEITPQIERGSLLFLQAAKDALGPQGSLGKPALHPSGGGGTHVAKVEIVVTSNQEPSRIARAVEVEWVKKMHRSGRSPDVANYSRPAGT